MKLSHNEQFVLTHYGLNERHMPRLSHLDFDAMAAFIRKPTKTALCNVLDGDGKIVADGGGPIRVGVTV